jgi:hypothetical protein
MTTYIISGPTLTLDIDGGDGNIAVANTVNPITGGMGLHTARIVNTTTANLAVVTYTPSDVTYEFGNVAWTTDSVAGANAEIAVTVTNSGYVATFVAAGVDFLANDTITVLGSQVGGTTTANDLVITVTDVDANGAITGSTVAGTQLWPQSVVGNITLLPNSESFIQITNNATIGAYFACTGSGGNLLITPVTIV